MKRRLANNRSPRWAIWDRIEVPNLDHPAEIYLTRWRLIQTPWFGIYLHRMDGPDSRATLHDHPWNFRSIILHGGYVEQFAAEPMLDRIETRFHRAGTVNRLRTRNAHFIAKLLRVPTWTLMFVGRRTRTWGYWDRSRAPSRYRTWTAFDVHPHAAEFDAAMAWRKEHGR